MTALVIAMFWAMTVQAQESQDSIESVNKLVALQEVVIKGGLPNTRLKAGALIAFYIIELGFNTKAGYEYSTRLLLPLGLSLLTFGLGLVFAKWQLRRHAQQLGEIERGLEELREFEK